MKLKRLTYSKAQRIKKDKKLKPLDVWKIVSEVRRRDGADVQGITKCCTCGYKAHWKTMDAGHFIDKRGFSSPVSFEDMNIHAQCKTCNGQLNGNKRNYKQFMAETYDESEIETLIYNSHKILHNGWGQEELSKIKNEYQRILDELNKENNE